MDQSEFKLGIVVMLDALGVRNISKEEVKGFLAKREKLEKTISENLAEVKKWSHFQESELTGPSFLTLADTIIIYWPIKKENPMDLLAVGELLRRVMKSGFEQGLLLRGAIGMGEYIQEKNIIIGPVVSDVSNWYERADWAGVIGTPHFGIRLSLLKEQFRKKFPVETMSAWFDEYNVPLAGEEKHKKHKLWALCWPSAYYQVEDPEKVTVSAKENFLTALKQFTIPIEAFQKFSNTIDFFDWFENKAKEVATALKSFTKKS